MFSANVEIVNKVKKLGNSAFDVVRSLLSDIPSVRITTVEYELLLGREYEIDGSLTFAIDRVNVSLLVEVIPNGAPRFVRSGIYRLESYLARMQRECNWNAGRRFIPIIVSRYLSPESRAICTDHDVAFVDFIGNARLVFDSVYIDRVVAEQPVTETRALRSLFSTKAAAILRVLLREPERAWKVADLASEARASYGHVSNVRKALLEREWLRIESDGVVLDQPGALLQMWRENYRLPVGELVSGYTIFHGKQLDEQLHGKLSKYGTGFDVPRAIYSMHSAAQWLAPYGRNATHTFYVDEKGAEVLKAALKLTRSTKGSNVILSVIHDEDLFNDAWNPTPNVYCTSPVATYLDLSTGNDRDQEAAAQIASKFFPWMS